MTLILICSVQQSKLRNFIGKIISLALFFCKGIAGEHKTAPQSTRAAAKQNTVNFMKGWSILLEF